MTKAAQDYFNGYGPMQRLKHKLLKRYLEAWFPILGQKYRKILYIETHAGRGEHRSGALGSPLIAATTLLSHSRKAEILKRCRVVFSLMEKDPGYITHLRARIAEMPVHNSIDYEAIGDDFAAVLEARLGELERSGGKMAPAFVFVDPFGYSIPISLIHRLLQNPSCEVWITFMADYVAMAMVDSSKAGLLNSLYGHEDWRCATNRRHAERVLLAVELYRKSVAARWCTAVGMHGERDYALLHFTNNPSGRDEFKRAVWAITKEAGKEGSFDLYRVDDPLQTVLLTEEPSIEPLLLALRTSFAGQTVQYSRFVEWVRDTSFLATHLHQALTKGRQQGWLATKHKGAFGPKTHEAITIHGALL